MRRWASVLVSLFAIAQAGGARADSAADFYRGKSVTMLIPSGVGGGFDLYARFIARYIGEFIPGRPSVIVKNVPGAGGILAANDLFSTVAPDGLTFGELQYSLALNQLVKTPSIAFDLTKFAWIGSMDTSSTICILSGPAKNLSGAKLLAQPVLIGGAGGSSIMIPLLLNSLAGAHFKLVQGYESTSNVNLAMQNGEVNGQCGWAWDGARVIARPMLDKQIAKVGLDIGTQPQAELKAMGVPFLMDLLPNGENKQVLSLILGPQLYSRPFAAPPGVPADRLQALRSAFAQALRDPALLAQAKKLGIEVDYLPGPKVGALIQSMFDSPARIQNRAAQELEKAGFKS